MPMNIQSTIQARIRGIHDFREYLMQDFTHYLRENGAPKANDTIPIDTLVRMVEAYDDKDVGEVRDAQRRMRERLRSLPAPDLMKVVDILSDITFDLKKSLAQREIDLQLLQYCQGMDTIFDDFDGTTASHIDVSAMCQRIESLGVRYNETTDHYSHDLTRAIREQGDDKDKALSLIERFVHAAQDNVMQNEHLDMAGHPYVGKDDRTALRNYSEEISNLGMYVLSMQVGRTGLPAIIQKVRERGDAYNIYTQRASQNIVEHLQQALAHHEYSDNEIQAAAMGILMGSAKGISPRGDE